MSEKTIEVFRDLELLPRRGLEEVREAILRHSAEPWAHAASKEEEMSGASSDEDVIAFTRSETGVMPKVALVLWQFGDHYRVSNIVPEKSGELGISRYNEILEDFIAHVVAPAAAEVDAAFTFRATAGGQTLEDWMSAEAAAALRRFSALANKSTGRSHPNDQKRWFDFLIASYRSEQAADSERIHRWLREVDRWPDDTASELASEYSMALELLARYDNSAQ